MYILRCSDQSLYAGVTTDLQRRLQEHNGELGLNSKGAKYTRARQPVELVYSESAFDRSSACAREAAIKKLSRKQKLALIEGLEASQSQ